jgi:hypothetical protein
LEGINWLEEVGNNKGSKEGQQWAALTDAFFREESAPRSIVQFTMDSVGFVVEKFGEGEDFGKVGFDYVEELFAEDTIELIG